MNDEPRATDQSESSETAEQAPNTWLNALLGAAVSVFLGFIPFSPVLGGAVAGYLEGGDLNQGGRAGALSGVFAAIPFAMILVAFAALVLIGGGGRAIVFFAFIVMVIAGFYTIVLSALGGVLGVYVKEEV